MIIQIKVNILWLIYQEFKIKSLNISIKNMSSTLSWKYNCQKIIKKKRQLSNYSILIIVNSLSGGA